RRASDDANCGHGTGPHPVKDTALWFVPASLRIGAEVVGHARWEIASPCSGWECNAEQCGRRCGVCGWLRAHVIAQASGHLARGGAARQIDPELSRLEADVIGVVIRPDVIVQASR